jgi:hypothetical protein
MTTLALDDVEESVDEDEAEDNFSESSRIFSTFGTFGLSVFSSFTSR